MSKWVENEDIKFTCQRDIWKYLIDGGVVMAWSNLIVKLNNNGFLALVDDENHCLHYCFNEYQRYKPLKKLEWYEDIPEHGVLCFANTASGKVPLLVTDCKNGICSTKGQGYWGMDLNKIQPATKEEAMQYILEP